MYVSSAERSLFAAHKSCRQTNTSHRIANFALCSCLHRIANFALCSCLLWASCRVVVSCRSDLTPQSSSPLYWCLQPTAYSFAPVPSDLRSDQRHFSTLRIERQQPLDPLSLVMPVHLNSALESLAAAPPSDLPARPRSKHVPPRHARRAGRAFRSAAPRRGCAESDSGAKASS